uniref:LOW QUALITY PROTEIN: protein HAIKU1 n=1 Tax=Elaeis guineensis var. tenera TaxID=51953 RepID=A0A8N4F910_ELAGV|nr:LOW QUALITY PROTEIN: protein HAIKU1 [Elaeis guineensis]
MKAMENPNNHHRHHHLGVNQLGRTIKKIPAAPAHRPPPPPQARVYNISKNDFRYVVQQLTGTPTRDSSSSSSSAAAAAGAAIPPPSRHPRASLRLRRNRPPPLAPPSRPNPAPNPSTIADYISFIENSLLHSDGSRPTPPPGPPAFPSPRAGPLLPSPGSSALQSPSAFLNLVSPRSPYALLSPGIQQPAPLTPSFPLSPGFLRPRPPPPPPSPGFFPPSPSGLLPFASPKWNDL